MAGDEHHLAADADRRYLWTAFVLIVALMAGEVVAGLLSSSLALITDAAHMLTDAAAIGLALVAIRLAARPSQGSFTFGFKRAEVLSAQANGLTLVLLALFFVVEAVRRLVHPPQVEAPLMLVVALAGIAVNGLATYTLGKANRRSINVEGSFRHIVTDLYAFVGTAVAALVILLWGFDRADPVASLVVAAIMARAGVRLVRDSWRVFLEAAPRGVDPGAVRDAMLSVDDVVDVHELHVWEVTSGFPSLSAHVLVAPTRDCHERREAVAAMLADRFGIDHSTLQVDHRGEFVATEDLQRMHDGDLSGSGVARATGEPDKP